MGNLFCAPSTFLSSSQPNPTIMQDIMKSGTIAIDENTFEIEITTASHSLTVRAKSEVELTDFVERGVLPAKEACKATLELKEGGRKPRLAFAFPHVRTCCPNQTRPFSNPPTRTAHSSQPGGTALTLVSLLAPPLPARTLAGSLSTRDTARTSAP